MLFRSGKASFLKDKSDNIVLTKLNEPMCLQIASAGNGVYVRADNSNIALRTIMKEIDDMQKGEIMSKNFAAYDELQLKMMYFTRWKN